MRQLGTYEQSFNYEVKIEGMLDARMLVPTLADLLTFTESNYLPNGFVVSVFDDEPTNRGFYQLIDNTNLSDIASWIKLDATNITASNGLTSNGGNIQLGGPLIQNTVIGSSLYVLDLGDSVNGSAEIYINPATKSIQINALDNPNTGAINVTSTAIQIIKNGTIGNGSINLDDNGISIGYNPSVGSQNLNFLGASGIQLTDATNNKGFVYTSDYSTVGLTDDRWIPDLGTIKALIPSVTDFVSKSIEDTITAYKHFNVGSYFGTRNNYLGNFGLSINGSDGTTQVANYGNDSMSIADNSNTSNNFSISPNSFQINNNGNLYGYQINFDGSVNLGSSGFPSIFNSVVRGLDAVSSSDYTTLGQVTSLIPDVSGFATDADVVHITGDESIDGIKTFNDSILFPNGNSTTPSVRVTNTSNSQNLSLESNNTTVRDSSVYSSASTGYTMNSVGVFHDVGSDTFGQRIHWTTSAPIASTDIYFQNGSGTVAFLTDVPALPSNATNQQIINASHVAFWGDSLTSSVGAPDSGYVIDFAATTGYTTYNGGVGGENSTQIATRMLAATDKYGYAVVIWAGRNDITQSVSPTTIKSNIASMVAALGHTRYIIIGITKLSTEITGNANANIINTLNSDLSTLYGTRFFDVQAYMLTQGDGSTQDNTDIANGVTPTSKRFDTTHLNSIGYQLVANQLVTKLSILQSSSTNTIVVLNSAALSPYAVTQYSLTTGGQYQIGGQQVLWLPKQYNGTTTSTRNLVLGDAHALTTGTGNTIGGIGTGAVITTGNNNTSWGALAGAANISASGQSNFGFGAGSSATGIVTNFGYLAGSGITTAGLVINIGYNRTGVNTSGAIDIGGLLIGTGATATGTALAGNLGIAIAPTARLTLPAGTATAGTAPQKFTTGTLLTTPEAGTLEFASDRLSFTQTTGTTRQQLAYVNDLSAYLPLSGGTMTGTLNSVSITPAIDNTYNIGTLSVAYSSFYARNYNSPSNLVLNSGSGSTILFRTAGSTIGSLFSNSHLVLGSGADSGFNFDVPGTGRFTGSLTLATSAPLIFTSGSLLVTPAVGRLEFLTDRLYFTQTTGTTRQQLAYVSDITILASSVTKSLFTNTATKTVTNTTTSTSIIPTGSGSTIPTTTPVAGTVYRAQFGGIYTVPTLGVAILTVVVSQNGTTLATGTMNNFLMGGATNLSFDGNFRITNLTIGSSGTVNIAGVMNFSIGNNLARTSLDLNNVGASTTVNNSASAPIDIKIMWDTANSNRSITITQFSLEQEQ